MPLVFVFVGCDLQITAFISTHIVKKIERKIQIDASLSLRVVVCLIRVTRRYELQRKRLDNREIKEFLPQLIKASLCDVWSLRQKHHVFKPGDILSELTATRFCIYFRSVHHSFSAFVSIVHERQAVFRCSILFLVDLKTNGDNEHKMTIKGIH